jgi:hypothetical protein
MLLLPLIVRLRLARPDYAAEGKKVGHELLRRIVGVRFRR